MALSVWFRPVQRPHLCVHSPLLVYVEITVPASCLVFLGLGIAGADCPHPRAVLGPPASLLTACPQLECPAPQHHTLAGIDAQRCHVLDFYPRSTQDGGKATSPTSSGSEAPAFRRRLARIRVRVGPASLPANSFPRNVFLGAAYVVPEQLRTENHEFGCLKARESPAKRPTVSTGRRQSLVRKK